MAGIVGQLEVPASAPTISPPPRASALFFFFAGVSLFVRMLICYEKIVQFKNHLCDVIFDAV